MNLVKKAATTKLQSEKNDLAGHLRETEEEHAEQIADCKAKYDTLQKGYQEMTADNKAIKHESNYVERQMKISDEKLAEAKETIKRNGKLIATQTTKIEELQRENRTVKSTLTFTEGELQTAKHTIGEHETHSRSKAVEIERLEDVVKRHDRISRSEPEKKNEHQQDIEKRE